MTIFIWPFQSCPNFSSFWLLSHQRVFQCVLNNKELIAHPGQAESMWESLQLFSKHDLCIWFKSWVWGSTIRKAAVCFLLSLEIKKRIFHWAHDIVHICWQHGGCGYPLRGTIPDDYITTRFQFLSLASERQQWTRTEPASEHSQWLPLSRLHGLQSCNTQYDHILADVSSIITFR